jgi:hypothetical protein
MGRWALDWAFEQQVAGATAKAVLLVIAKHANNDGVCFPSCKTIAALACCNEKTVRRLLAKLEAKKLLLRKRRWRTDGRRTTDLLVLPIPRREASKGQQGPEPADIEARLAGRHVRAESGQLKHGLRKALSDRNVVPFPGASSPSMLGAIARRRKIEQGEDGEP